MLDGDRLHPERVQDLVGRASQLELPDARVPGVRRVHPGRRGRVHRGDHPGDRGEDLEAAAGQYDVSRVSSDLIEENKWRAVRYGLDGRLVDFGKGVELPARELVRELLQWFIDDVLDELGSRQGSRVRLPAFCDEGSSARPPARARSQSHGDLKAVVDHVIAETAEGL